MEMIPYLKDQELLQVNSSVHRSILKRGNYWGYMTSISSPRHEYGTSLRRPNFREMVKAFTQPESVWLDVVYNHTSEAGCEWSLYSYRASTRATTSSGRNR
jgi:pullulanase/glycogen debranching enzyme